MPHTRPARPLCPAGRIAEAKSFLKFREGICCRPKLLQSLDLSFATPVDRSSQISMYALQQYLPSALGLSLVAASLNSAALDSMQNDVPAFFLGAFAALALTLGMCAWMTVSHLLAIQDAELLIRARRKAHGSRNRKKETRTVYNCSGPNNQTSCN